jgi:hypothetical protein
LENDKRGRSYGGKIGGSNAISQNKIKNMNLGQN